MLKIPNLLECIIDRDNSKLELEIKSKEIMRIVLILIIVSFLFSCKGQTADKLNANKVEDVSNQEDSLVTFLIYGELAPDGYLDSENEITEQYGFKLDRIAGCEVEEDLVNKVKTNNKKALALMEKRYGFSWMQNFEKETNFKLAIPIE